MNVTTTSRFTLLTIFIELTTFLLINILLFLLYNSQIIPHTIECYNLQQGSWKLKLLIDQHIRTCGMYSTKIKSQVFFLSYIIARNPEKDWRHVHFIISRYAMMPIHATGNLNSLILSLTEGPNCFLWPIKNSCQLCHCYIHLFKRNTIRYLVTVPLRLLLSLLKCYVK